MSKQHILYVRNISNRARHEEIRHHFAKYGEIYDINIPLDYYTGRMKGYAFIEYNHSSDAREAHRRLDRTDFLGRIIEIEFARGQRRTPAEMMRMEGRDGGGGFRNDRDGDMRRSRSRSRSHGRRSRSHSPPAATKKTESSSTRRRRSPSPPSPPSSASRHRGGGGSSRRDERRDRGRDAGGRGNEKSRSRSRSSR